MTGSPILRRRTFGASVRYLLGLDPALPDDDVLAELTLRLATPPPPPPADLRDLVPAHPDVNVEIAAITNALTEQALAYTVELLHRPSGIRGHGMGPTVVAAHRAAWDHLASLGPLPVRPS